MLKIRVLEKEELPLLLGHAYEVGLDVEELHLKCQFTLHQEDFFIAHKDDALVGFIVALKHSDNFAFISNLLVLKEFRGHGYAKMLLAFALEHLQDAQIALDSSYETTHFYEKAGFSSYFDLHTFLYITTNESHDLGKFNFQNYENSTSANKTNNYLQCLLKNKDVSYISLETDAVLNSFNITFPYKDGYKIVIDAQKLEQARALFFKLSQSFEEGVSIYMDATKLNPIFLTLAKELAMIELSKSARMYNKVY